MAWVRVLDKQNGKQRVVSEGVAKTLKDRFEILTDNVEQKDEVISFEEAKAPNVEAAPAKSVEPAADDELETLRKRYEEVYGSKPHGRTGKDSLKKLIADKENA